MASGLKQFTPLHKCLIFSKKFSQVDVQTAGGGDEEGAASLDVQGINGNERRASAIMDNVLTVGPGVGGGVINFEAVSPSVPPLV
jgi:hypothetical protein